MFSDNIDMRSTVSFKAENFITVRNYFQYKLESISMW